MFSGHRLERDGDGYTLFLYVDMSPVEFSAELGSGDEEISAELLAKIQDYIKTNLKGVKVTAVKLMLGTAVAASVVLGGGTVTQAAAPGTAAVVSEAGVPATHTVQPGDTLWAISKRYGLTVDFIKRINGLTGDTIYPGQKLKLAETVTRYLNHTVQKGDTLWAIAQKYGTTVNALKTLNKLTSDTIYPGQSLKVKEITGVEHIVKAGDTLWAIAKGYGSTVNGIKEANRLAGDTIYPGQKLLVPLSPGGQGPGPVYQWPDVTYVVQPGDTVTSIAKKFNTTPEAILRYNYMSPGEWLDAGDRIAISGYAPRVYTVTPGEAKAPARVGKVVDWVLEGQYILKRGSVFTVVDVNTGLQFKAKMGGGYNHADIEPLTSADTEVMKRIFGSWQWSPRAVVVYINGMNIAASLSGMPHSEDFIANNGVSGHFDLYMLNSTSHSASTSQDYINQHRSMVLKAGGQ